MNKIIYALIQTVLTEALHKDLDHDQVVVNAAYVLERKIKAMPFILRNAMTILTYVFNAYGLIAAGKAFTSMSKEQRRKQFYQWKESPVGLFGDFIGFYEKMSVFIYLSLCQNKH
jgi:hypothetical protein